MKKVLLIMVAVMGLAFAANAQNIGIRFGGVENLGAELSGQFGLGSSRLEVDLGWWHNYGIFGSAIWQHTSNIIGGLGWFAGAGAHLGIYDKKFNETGAFALAAMGQLGLEYDFVIPIQLTLDWRPALYVIPSFTPRFSDVAFGIRYRF